jgi:hypothetical protein
MANENLPDPTASGSGLPIARLSVVLLTVAVAAVAVAGLVSRNSDEPLPSTPSSHGDPATTVTATTIGTRAEVTTRLREILAVRDRALSERDASLLINIYTSDCKCLKDGRALISQLRKEGIVWKGVKTSVMVRDIEEASERLWIITAMVATPTVRVETETGKLVRTVPPERNLVRFALAKPQDEGEWLLGHASAFD